MVRSLLENNPLLKNEDKALKNVSDNNFTGQLLGFCNLSSAWTGRIVTSREELESQGMEQKERTTPFILYLF